MNLNNPSPLEDERCRKPLYLAVYYGDNPGWGHPISWVFVTFDELKTFADGVRSFHVCPIHERAHWIERTTLAMKRLDHDV